MKVTNIGYKTAFSGDKMFHYKVEYNDKEYLIIDAGLPVLLDMQWMPEDIFDDSDLTESELEKIEAIIANVPNSTVELAAVDGEKAFYKSHNYVAPERVIIKRARGVYDRDQVNDLLSLLQSNDLADDGEGTITQEMADEANSDEYEG